MRELFWGLFDVWKLIQEMTWQITVVILFVLLFRVFIGKVSKQGSYFLWLIVAIRLLFPTMPESEFSIFNVIKTEFIDTNTVVSEELPGILPQENIGSTLHTPAGNLDVTFEDSYPLSEDVADIVPEESNVNVPSPPVTETHQPSYLFEGHMDLEVFFRTYPQFALWLLGTVAMCFYGVISYCVLGHRLRFATTDDRKVYEDEHIASPFVFGIIKPRIYLPYRLSDEERDYILRHENYHIRRRDYLVKIFAFGLLTIYWFHPLVWVAYYVMSRDMELSCDEQVLKELGIAERKAYSTLLLSFASRKRFPLPSPVSFGENDIKSRIKGILYYKKPTFWSMTLILILIATLAVGCLTDAKDKANNTDSSEEDYEITDEQIKELAEALFENKGSYIGDVVTNGKILNVLFEELGIVAGRGGMELQTRMEPYWISISFEERPDDNKMWQVAAMYLALVENANEVRWNYYDEYSTMHTYYVTTDMINSQLDDIALKSYGTSEEKIAELWNLLDETRKKTLPDPNDSKSPLVLSTFWDKYAINAGMDFTERIEWENRLIADGIHYRGDEGDVDNCIYGDFDHNGVKDCIIVTLNKNWQDDIGNRFCIYMNNGPVYTYDIDYTGIHWGTEIADIDNDSFMEFLFYGDSGGTGGFGFNALYELLKYKNGSFEKMPLPLDDYCEWEDETTGFGIEIYTAEGEGNYIAYSPALNQSIAFSIGSSRSDVFDTDTPANTLVGREYYGFHELTPVMQNGRYYLLAKEAVSRVNIFNRGEVIGTAHFLLNWHNKTGWVVEAFDVLPYSYDDGISDEAIFDRMLRELVFYPLSYDDIMKDPELPAIDKEHFIIKDNNGFNSLQKFAEYESGEMEGYAGNSIVYASVYGNDAPVYHYIYRHTDGRYFYLEAFAEKSKLSYEADVTRESYVPIKTEIYADCIYDCWDGSDGFSNVFYYLVEEGVTSKDIMEYMLSSAYKESDFVSFLTVRKPM